MANYQTRLLKVNDIAGMFYGQDKPSDTLVVYGIGAPLVPDSGQLPDAPEIMKFETDLFVPDYRGYGRSDGIFTPMGCIQTFLDLYQWFSEGVTATNSYLNFKVKLSYKRILFVGRSFGGTYVPLLPRFNKNIKELCLVFPAINNSVYGTLPNEESNEDFMRAMEFDGYGHLYRGILDEIWVKHLAEKDDLSPMDAQNMKHLDEAWLFIGHGTEDKGFHFSRTQNYYDKLTQVLGDDENRRRFRLYKGSGHEPQTSNQVVRDFITWRGVPKR